MRTLEKQEAEDVLYGACIFGTGGGGNLEEGLRIIHNLYQNGKKVKIISLEEVENDWLVASPYYVGSVAPPKKEVMERLENLPILEDNVSVIATKALQTSFGRKFNAVIATELGANVAWAMETAAVLDIPLVDADPAGRAVPDIAHTTFNIFDVPIAPFALANKYGDKLTVSAVANHDRAEDIARNFATVSGNIAGICDHPVLGGKLKSSVIAGTISNSESVGKAMRIANEQGISPIEPISIAGNGRVLLKGIITSADWTDTGGFIEGDISITSFDGQESISLWFRNEHMIARKENEIVAVIPELITVIDLQNGKPILNPFCEKGMVVAILTFPAPDTWETEKGLSIFGPEYVGVKEEVYFSIKGQKQAITEEVSDS